MNARERFENESGKIRARMQTIHAWTKAHPEPDRNARLRDILDDIPSSNALSALLAAVADARDAALARELCETNDADSKLVVIRQVVTADDYDDVRAEVLRIIDEVTP